MNNNKRYLFFIIPGNPPASYYYNKWIDEIKNRVDICECCVSNYRFFLDEQNSWIFMEKMYRHIECGFLKFLSKFGSKSKVIVLGHSIGAYFAIRLSERHPEKLKSIFLLFPFLSKPRLEGKTILEVGTMLKPFHGYFNRTNNMLSKLFPQLDRLTDNEIKTGLRLMTHEKNTIMQMEKPLIYLRNKTKHGAVFYCENDIWCSDTAVRYFKTGLPVQRLNVSHAFVMSDNERDIVFEGISKYL